MRLANDGYYPAPPGGRLEGVGTHLGPASYTPVTTGSPPTGGDTLNADEFGLKVFDSVEVLGYDATGEYTAFPIWDAGIDERPSSVKLVWFHDSGATPRTDREVTSATDLSEVSLRIRVTGE